MCLVFTCDDWLNAGCLLREQVDDREHERAWSFSSGSLVRSFTILICSFNQRLLLLSGRISESVDIAFALPSRRSVKWLFASCTRWSCSIEALGTLWCIRFSKWIVLRRLIWSKRIRIRLWLQVTNDNRQSMLYQYWCFCHWRATNCPLFHHILSDDRVFFLHYRRKPALNEANGALSHRMGYSTKWAKAGCQHQWSRKSPEKHISQFVRIAVKESYRHIY